MFEFNSNLDYFSTSKNCQGNLFKWCIKPGVHRYVYISHITSPALWPFPFCVLWIIYLQKDSEEEKERGLALPLHWASLRPKPIHRSHYKKKDTSVTFWAEQKYFLSYLWHFYDDNCDKTCQGYTPRYDPTGSMTRSGLAFSLVTCWRTGDSHVWRLTGLTTHKPGDSLMAPTAGQTDDKAQGPEGRLVYDGLV